MASRERDSARRHRRSPSLSRSRSPRSPAQRSRSRSFSPNGRAAAAAPAPASYRRRAETDDGNPHYSSYYRDRFGSESPKEYQNLRITNIDPKVSNDELRDVLEKYLGRFGDMNVKVIRQMDAYERIAYVNFERTGDARDARHGCLQKLVNALGRRLTVDPAGVLLDQDGRYVKPSVPGAGPHRQSPPSYAPREYVREDPFRRDGDRSRERYYEDRDREKDYGRGYRNDRR